MRARCSSTSFGQTLLCLAWFSCYVLLRRGLKSLWQLHWLLVSRVLLERLQVILPHLLLFLVGGYLGLLPCLTSGSLALAGLWLRGWRVLTCAVQTEATWRWSQGSASRSHGPGRLSRFASVSFFDGSNLLFYRSTSCLGLTRHTLILLVGPSTLAILLW